MGNRRHDVQGWKTSASRKSARLNSTRKPNVFEILVDEGQVSPFLDLPRELRDNIYALLLNGATINQRIEYSHDVQRELGQRKLDSTEYLTCSYPNLRSNNDTAKLHSLALVNKQVSHEFLEAMNRQVPAHLYYGTGGGSSWYVPRNMQLYTKVRPQELSTKVPSTAYMSFNSKFYTDSHNRELLRRPEEFQRAFVKREPFQHLMNLLSTCKQTTHVIFHFTVHLRSRNRTRYAECKIIHDYLQTVLESMPRLLCYSLVVRSWMAKNILYQTRYARRDVSQSWDPANSTKFIFDSAHCSGLEAKHRAKGLGLLSGWSKLYETLGCEDSDIPDCFVDRS